MSERWVQRGERILERIKSLETSKERDRLELIRSMGFVLRALWNSVQGWMQWINNPDIMTKFSQEELDEMNKTITEYVKSFIEYDVKISKQGIQKGIDRRRTRTRRERTVREQPDRLVI